MKKKNLLRNFTRNIIRLINSRVTLDKKIVSTVGLIAPIVLFVLFALIPLFELIAALTGLDFVIGGQMLFALLLMLLSLAAAAFFAIFKPEISKANEFLLLFALPLGLISAISFAVGSNKWTVIPMLIALSCLLSLYNHFVPDGNIKAASAVVSVLLAMAFGVVWAWGVLSGIFVSELVVDSEYISIDGQYKAEVCIDDSLLSTKTVVRIARTDAEFGVIVGRFYKKSAIVYEGEDYEYKTVQINWLDETTVIINGREYSVN